MKLLNKKIIMETVFEALNIWERPHCADYVGGGQASIRYAGWEYLGICPDTPVSESGVHLEAATTGVESFYKTLCDNARLYASDGFSFDFDTGLSTFPEEGNMIKVLTAYKNNPEHFTLAYIHSDCDVYMKLSNRKNSKTLKISVIGTAEEHHAFYALMYLFQEQRAAKKQISAKNTVEDFLAQPWPYPED